MIDPDKTDEYPNPYPIENRKAAMALEEAVRRIESKRQEVMNINILGTTRKGDFYIGWNAGANTASSIINDVLSELLPPQ